MAKNMDDVLDTIRRKIESGETPPGIQGRGVGTIAIALGVLALIAICCFHSFA